MFGRSVAYGGISASCTASLINH